MSMRKKGNKITLRGCLLAIRMNVHDCKPIYQQNSALYNSNVYGYNTLALPVSICNNDLAKNSDKAHVVLVIPVATLMNSQLIRQSF